MRINFATEGNIGGWMQLVRRVAGSFPGLESEDALSAHARTTLDFIARREAIFASDGGISVGVLLFSREEGMLCFLAVAPEYRRRHIARGMLQLALSQIPAAKAVTVTTYREGDAEGEAARAFYSRLGFTPGRLTEEFGVGVQEFVLSPRTDDKITVRALESAEVEEALSLTWRVFLDYEAADYSEEGVADFYRAINDPEYLSALHMYGAFCAGQLVGLIATRDGGTHIALFYVDGGFHRRGIGRRLFDAARRECPTDKMTVNSSRYAVDAYCRLGFRPLGGAQTVNGLRFTPMELTV